MSECCRWRSRLSPPVSSSAFYASPSPALDSAAVDVVVGHSHLISSRQIVRAGRIRRERKRAAEATLVSSPAFNLHSSSPPQSAVSPSPFPATSNIFLATSRGRICGALSAAGCGCGGRAEGGRTDDTFPCFAHRSFSIRPLMLTPSPPSLPPIPPSVPSAP